MPDRADRDVIGLGNALVDVITSVDESFLTTHSVAKGAMTLIDEARAGELYAAMPPGREISGGSAANTIAGVASFGGATGYFSKISDDQFGQVFAHDLRALGTVFQTPPLADGPSTGRCLILVTPDAQRSMSTFLGASSFFSQSDVDADLIRGSAYAYLEGYLFDRKKAKRAFVHASEIARAAGRKVALTLSDGFCVDRHRDSFRQLVRHHVDVLFANEDEIISLYEVGDFDAALARARADKVVGFLTRSEKGSVVLTETETISVAAAPVTPGVIDTTGAGDLYAAGALFGLARGLSFRRCAELGSIAAAEVISHYGARPETSLKELARGVLGG
ncbi:MAG: adenosine kinase [Caulobacterales bacterium]|nr:adenosine kinase [Caulobacterales bacterium]